ncbi:hypothetical protein JL721_654 [Aureococcus anophagefferens]|nr:hypothetical protein JL721_654 [Aureococcus anophagefferens]
MDPFCVVVRCEAAPAKGREQELVFEAPQTGTHVAFDATIDADCCVVLRPLVAGGGDATLVVMIADAVGAVFAVKDQALPGVGDDEELMQSVALFVVEETFKDHAADHGWASRSLLNRVSTEEYSLAVRVVTADNVAPGAPPSETKLSIDVGSYAPRAFAEVGLDTTLEQVCRAAFGSAGTGDRVVVRVDIDGLVAPDWTSVDVSLVCGPHARHRPPRAEASSARFNAHFRESSCPARLDAHFARERDAPKAIEALLRHPETSLRCALSGGACTERALSAALPTRPPAALNEAFELARLPPGGPIARKRGSALKVVLSLPDPDLDRVQEDMSALLRRCVPSANHAYPKEVVVLLGDRYGAVTYEAFALAGRAFSAPCRNLALEALEAFHANASLPAVKQQVAKALLRHVECHLAVPPRHRQIHDILDAFAATGAYDGEAAPYAPSESLSEGVLRNAMYGGDGRDATGRSYLILVARTPSLRLVRAVHFTLRLFAKVPGRDEISCAFRRLTTIRGGSNDDAETVEAAIKRMVGDAALDGLSGDDAYVPRPSSVAGWLARPSTAVRASAVWPSGRETRCAALVLEATRALIAGDAVSRVKALKRLELTGKVKDDAAATCEHAWLVFSMAVGVFDGMLDEAQRTELRGHAWPLLLDSSDGLFLDACKSVSFLKFISPYHDGDPTTWRVGLLVLMKVRQLVLWVTELPCPLAPTDVAAAVNAIVNTVDRAHRTKQPALALLHLAFTVRFHVYQAEAKAKPDARLTIFGAGFAAKEQRADRAAAEKARWFTDAATRPLDMGGYDDDQQEKLLDLFHGILKAMDQASPAVSKLMRSKLGDLAATADGADDLAAAALRTLDDPAVRAADCFSDALFVEIASIVPPIVASMTRAATDGESSNPETELPPKREAAKKKKKHRRKKAPSSPSLESLPPPEVRTVARCDAAPDDGGDDDDDYLVDEALVEAAARAIAAADDTIAKYDNAMAAFDMLADAEEEGQKCEAAASALDRLADSAQAAGDALNDVSDASSDAPKEAPKADAGPAAKKKRRRKKAAAKGRRSPPRPRSGGAAPLAAAPRRSRGGGAADDAAPVEAPPAVEAPPPAPPPPAYAARERARGTRGAPRLRRGLAGRGGRARRARGRRQGRRRRRGDGPGPGPGRRRAGARGRDAQTPTAGDARSRRRRRRRPAPTTTTGCP